MDLWKAGFGLDGLSEIGFNKALENPLADWGWSSIIENSLGGVKGSLGAVALGPAAVQGIKAYATVFDRTISQAIAPYQGSFQAVAKAIGGISLPDIDPSINNTIRQMGMPNIRDFNDVAKEFIRLTDDNREDSAEGAIIPHIKEEIKTQRQQRSFSLEHIISIIGLLIAIAGLVVSIKAQKPDPNVQATAESVKRIEAIKDQELQALERMADAAERNAAAQEGQLDIAEQNLILGDDIIAYIEKALPGQQSSS